MTPTNLQDQIKELQELISNNVMQVKDVSISKEIANEHPDNDLHNEILKNVAESSIKNHEQKRKLKKTIFLDSNDYVCCCNIRWNSDYYNCSYLC